MLILVRHGETAFNASHVVQPEDTPLNERGRAQALRLAARLASLEAAHVLCSDMPRACMTAEPLLRARGCSMETTPLLQERNFGELRGRPYAEIGQDIFAPDYVPPAGESWAAFDARVELAWQHVQARALALPGNLVVITHGLVCHSIARRFLTLTAPQELPRWWPNTSVTLCERAQPHGVHVLNCIAHLEDAPQGGAAV